ncbi:hypothetical protein Nepgr_010855 [Nepenthes gracilis]|uniref:Protein COFACTOR ASSEMBLY OF COMPLEX C SUBUNIT B CCB2, chloroplastic n=1 Tax=Nepenthes gracilis TaxID=150966 RepID=A0AAD3XLQ9_NEPGR|nr:hypothetical protein Nepgr_010855 [Nepenthes gracilis]
MGCLTMNQSLPLSPSFPSWHSVYFFHLRIPSLNVATRREVFKLSANGDSSRTTNAHQQLNLSVLRFTFGIPWLDESYLPRWIGYAFGSLILLNHFAGTKSSVTSAQLISEALGLSLAGFSATLPYLGMFLKGATPMDKITLPEGAEQIFVMSQNVSESLKEDLAWAAYVLLRNTNSVSVLIYVQDVLCVRGYWSKPDTVSRSHILDWFRSQIEKFGLSDTKDTLYFPQRADSGLEELLPQGTSSVLIQSVLPSSKQMVNKKEKAAGFLLLASSLSFAYSDKDRCWIGAIANKFRGSYCHIIILWYCYKGEEGSRSPHLKTDQLKHLPVVDLRKIGEISGNVNAVDDGIAMENQFETWNTCSRSPGPPLLYFFFFIVRFLGRQVHHRGFSSFVTLKDFPRKRSVRPYSVFLYSLDYPLLCVAPLLTACKRSFSPYPLRARSYGTQHWRPSWEAAKIGFSRLLRISSGLTSNLAMVNTRRAGGAAREASRGEGANPCLWVENHPTPCGASWPRRAGREQRSPAAAKDLLARGTPGPVASAASTRRVETGQSSGPRRKPRERRHSGPRGTTTTATIGGDSQKRSQEELARSRRAVRFEPYELRHYRRKEGRLPHREWRPDRKRMEPDCCAAVGGGANASISVFHGDRDKDAPPKVQDAQPVAV